MSAVLLDEVIVPASNGLRFVDAATGQPVQDGLRCSLLRRRDHGLIASAQTTPAGVHHWPAIDAHWRDRPQPVPPAQALADVRVDDLFGRFLPLTVAWPLPPALGASLYGSVQLGQIGLLSTPQRPAPPGFASVFAQLVWQADGTPAAWARVTLTNLQGRVYEGCCDAQGRLALHLPLARPQHDPATQSTFASVAMKVFFDPTLAAKAPQAPDALAWRLQTEVRALARADEATALDTLHLEVGRPAAPVTEGLLPRRSELRLVAL